MCVGKALTGGDIRLARALPDAARRSTAGRAGAPSCTGHVHGRPLACAAPLRVSWLLTMGVPATRRAGDEPAEPPEPPVAGPSGPSRPSRPRPPGPPGRRSRHGPGTSMDKRGFCRRAGTGARVAAVADVRVLGAIGVVAARHPVDVAAATTAAVDRAFWRVRSGTYLHHAALCCSPTTRSRRSSARWSGAAQSS